MKLRNLIAAAAALSLAASPALAEASTDRAAAPVSDASELAGDTTALFGILALVGLIAAVIIVADNDDDEAVSP